MADQQYEYAVKNFDTKRPVDLRDQLNQYAREGWRLSETTEEEQSGTTYYILERPVE
jgi:hypothetical protein